MLITPMTPRASEKPLARMNRSAPKAIPLTMSLSTRAPRAVGRLTPSGGRRGAYRALLAADPARFTARGQLPTRPRSSLGELPGEDRVFEELLRGLLPELDGARDRRQHLLLVRGLDLEDVQVVHGVVQGVHAERPAGGDGQRRGDDFLDEGLRVLADPAGDLGRVHPGLLAMVRQGLVDPVGGGVGRLPPVRGRLAR